MVKTIKVLLVNPPYSKVYSKVATAKGISPPLGLAYLAAFLKKNNIKTEIFDANALQLNEDQITKKLPRGFDLVGVPSFTPSIDISVKILSIAKKVNPSCKTVIGGAHISAIPFETMKAYRSIDFGVIGEGEETLLELVKAIGKNKDFSKVRGLVYRKNGRIKINVSRPPIENLDELPFPAFELLPMDKYCLPLHHVGFGNNIPTNPFSLLFTSRGCPFNCTYCASKVLWGRKVRFRSAENVLGEIDFLVDKYGIKVLDIADDIFTINDKRLNKILDGLIERNYDLNFNCLSRVDSVKKQNLLKMKKAGCYLIRFGTESGSDRILKLMKKRITADQTRKAFKLTKKLGISSSASFIIGHPGETKKTVRQTIDLAKEIDPVISHFFAAIPLLGTELYEIAKNKNLITDMKWEFWTQMPEKPVLRTESLSIESLIKLRRRAYLEFYLRPSYIIKSLLRVKNFQQIKLYLNGFLAVKSLLE